MCFTWEMRHETMCFMEIMSFELARRRRTTILLFHRRNATRLLLFYERNALVHGAPSAANVAKTQVLATVIPSRWPCQCRPVRAGSHRNPPNSIEFAFSRQEELAGGGPQSFFFIGEKRHDSCIFLRKVLVQHVISFEK